MNTELVPPFNLGTATQKVQRGEDLWNSQDPQEIALAYSENSQWRNRNEFVQGRPEIIQLLTRKWQREFDYKLKKQLFSFSVEHIAVQFYYEYHDDSGQWFRAFGNEHWTFDEQGLMRTRDASINELAITASDRILF
ncbi:MAG: nuclear transport factor 2 (NTF2) superfamily protein [Candidatus Endobugula sp.]|jgi:nuclear transport factor 2 (NTF2) superfamily protein